MSAHPEIGRDLFKYQEKLRQIAPAEVPSMGLLPVIPIVKAGLAGYTAYQVWQTGKDIVNDPHVQNSWEKGKYIDAFGHSIGYFPFIGDAMRGGRAFALGDHKGAWLYPANALFTLYGGKVIGKGSKWIFNKVTPKVGPLIGAKWLGKQGEGKVKLPFDADALLKNATKVNKNGLTNAGRAFQKHVNRPGDILSGIKFSGKTANKDAQKIIQEILKSPNRKIKELEIGGYRVYDSVTKKCFDVSRTGNFNGFRHID